MYIGSLDNSGLVSIRSSNVIYLFDKQRITQKGGILNSSMYPWTSSGSRIFRYELFNLWLLQWNFNWYEILFNVYKFCKIIFKKFIFNSSQLLVSWLKQQVSLGFCSASSIFNNSSSTFKELLIYDRDRSYHNTNFSNEAQ